jgi:hypothetical protein
MFCDSIPVKVQNQEIHRQKTDECSGLRTYHGEEWRMLVKGYGWSVFSR